MRSKIKQIFDNTNYKFDLEIIWFGLNYNYLVSQQYIYINIIYLGISFILFVIYQKAHKEYEDDSNNIN